MTKTPISEIISYGSALRFEDLAGTLASGNVSCRRGSKLWITEKGQKLSGIVDKVAFLDFENGEAALKSGNPSTELPVHLAIYYALEEEQVKTDLMVAHVHPKYTTAFSVTGCPCLPILHYHHVKVSLNDIPVIPFKVPGSLDLAVEVEEVFRLDPTQHAVILANHGALIWAETARELLEYTQILEECCFYFLTTAGHHRSSISPSNVLKVQDMFTDYAKTTS